MVIKKFWNMARNEKTSENEIRIDGEIGFDFWAWLFGDDYTTGTSFREDLKQFADQPVTVWINSNGGNSADASQIYTALKEHKGRVTVKIDGAAISAASVIAMAGDNVLMSPTGVMMIHNPWTYAEGEVREMERAINVLNEVKTGIMNAYQIKTGRSREEISGLMDAETWMSAKKAIELGFVDSMLYEKEMQEADSEGILNGAKLVFNSLNKPDIKELAEKIKQYKEQAPASDEDAFIMQKRALALEKLRYGGNYEK